MALQIADVYVASRTIDLAADAPRWRVAEGLDAADDLAVAAYWLSPRRRPPLHTCHHLHGGMGVDVTYPLHRYYSWVKDIRPRSAGRALTLEAVAVEDAAPRTSS